MDELFRKALDQLVTTFSNLVGAYDGDDDEEPSFMQGYMQGKRDAYRNAAAWLSEDLARYQIRKVDDAS